MKPSLPLLCLLLGLAAPQMALAQATPVPKAEDLAMAATDAAAFARIAASANMLELESSKLALERSKDDKIIQFAQKMVDDHTAATEALKDAAETAGIELPTALNDADQDALDTLTAAEDFDRAYMDLQTKAHDEAVTLFQTFSTAAGDSPLRDFATATLPRLEEHQEDARTLSGV